MKTDSNLARPQLVFVLFGSTMLVLSWLGFAADRSISPSLPRTSQSGRLKVAPSDGVAPRSVINHLQGAGGLQGQDTEGLQQPIGEQLQPNAETNNLNTTPTVQ